MKILLATHFFPPGHPGGTEAYTYGLAQLLLRRGHSPYVICAEGWGSGDNWRPRHEDSVYEGVPVRRLFWNWESTRNPSVDLYDSHEVECAFGRYVGELQPDIVHMTSCYALGASPIRAAHNAGIPTFLTLTDFWFLCSRHTLLRGDGSLCKGPESAMKCLQCLASDSTVYRRLSAALTPDLAAKTLVGLSHVPSVARLRGMRGYIGDAEARFTVLRRIFDNVDVPIGPSRFLIRMFEQNGFPQGRIKFSPYGLDLSWLPKLRSRPPSSRLIFGYIGQIDPIKGVDVLVRAFRAVTSEPSPELRIYGDLSKRPGFADELRAIATGSDNIKFLDSFERTQIADVLSEIDVVVVPSTWYENTPLVISEAFAAGKPVIATNLGGMSEVVEHEVNGLLFERGNVADLTHAICRLANDRQLLEELRRGIPPVRTVEEEADDLIDRYQRAMRLGQVTR